MPLYTLTITHSHTHYLLLLVMMRSKELETSRSILMLILRFSLSVTDSLVVSPDEQPRTALIQFSFRDVVLTTFSSVLLYTSGIASVDLLLRVSSC